MKVLLDSNLFIAIHNQESDSNDCEKIINAIENRQLQGVLSTITIAEVLVGYYQIGEVHEIELLKRRFELNYEIIPVSMAIAQEAAEIRALNKIKLPDALIIATAYNHNVEIIISNDIPIIKKAKRPILTISEFRTQYPIYFK